MFRHLLIGIDGSAFALKAAAHGLELAKSVSAMASAVIVTPTWDSIALSEIAQGKFEENYIARMNEQAEACLGKVRELAVERRVVCKTLHLVADRPYDAIIKAAAENGCDMIVVGSHGRRGVQKLILGSETTKLLTHSKVPVLVYRE
jgi:nucleotide-binding universal stress UspA family protein